MANARRHTTFKVQLRSGVPVRRGLTISVNETNANSFSIRTARSPADLYFVDKRTVEYATTMTWNNVLRLTTY